MNCYTRLLLVLLLPGQIDGVYAHNQLESPSKVVVSDLRCEYLTDPLGIDTPHPRFSWKLLDPGKTHGQKQTA